jgi:hypothetical protein
MNSIPHLEAWKYPKGSSGEIKPGRPLRKKTQAELQSMIKEFKQLDHALQKDIEFLLSVQKKMYPEHKWDWEAAKLVGKRSDWGQHILVIFKRKMTPQELQKHDEAQLCTFYETD